LNWLFEVVVAPVVDPAATGEPSWRPYTNIEVGRALRESDPAANSTTMRQLRAGARATRDQLVAIAGFFGVGVEYFGDIPVEVEVVRDQVLDRALRDCDVLAYRMCRVPSSSPPRRRKQLQHALPILRLDPPGGTQGRLPMRSDEGRRARDGTESSTMRTVTQPMSAAQLRTLCHDVVRDLEMALPLDPFVLCERLGRRRGRPIRVRGADLGATTSVGHLVSQRRVDRILYDTAAPLAQRTLVIYHELVHLVRGHLDAGESLTCGVTLFDEADSDLSQRGMYTDWREWEAETGARILSTMSRARAQPNMLPARPRSAEHGIAAAFGFTARRRIDS
jgi:hypothetical protein